MSERLASALGLPIRAADGLATSIGDAQLLLLIDSCEHMLDALSPLVESLLASCPNLCVLATSREPLDIGGETRWSVPPLSLPPAEVADDPSMIIGFDAVDLFVSRAQSRDARFALSPDNAGLVSAICRRLDGVPLALELAAARVRALGLAEVVRRLDDLFTLLSHGSRTAIHRHRTIRATIDWSEELLDEPERVLFRRLGAFVGSFDLEAAVSVCSGEGLRDESVPHVLGRLVDKSLVMVHSTPSGGVRYSLLEMIRQYAIERLAAAGETELPSRHARHYAAKVNCMTPSDGPLTKAIEELDLDYDNVRLALDWAAGADAELQFEMVERLRWYWNVRGMVREGASYIVSALATSSAPPLLRARMHLGAATWLHTTGDLQGAWTNMDVAAELLDTYKDKRLACGLLSLRGLHRIEMGDPAGGESYVLEALALLREEPHDREMVMTLNNLAVARLLSGRPHDALAHAQRAVELWQSCTLGAVDLSRLSQVWHTYGAVLLKLGRVSEARAQFVRGLEVASESGSHEGALQPLLGLACAAASGDRPATCLTFLGAARRCAISAGVQKRRSHCTPPDEAERASRLALAPDAQQEAWNRGLQMSVSAALAYARANGHSTLAPAPARSNPVMTLTRRKLEIARLIAAGLSNKEIADQLSISVRTVEAHIDQLRSRLGCRSRAQIAAWTVSHAAEQAGD